MADADSLDVNAKAELERQASRSARLYCCASTGCKSSGADDIMSNLSEALGSHGLVDEVDIVGTGCMGLCAKGPLLRVEFPGKDPILFKEVDSIIGRLIVADFLLPVIEGRLKAEAIPSFLMKYVLDLKLPFFQKQVKIALANAGSVDPENIDDYIARGGYSGLKKAVTEMTPEQVAKEIKDSGLRGRGGAGFSTGLKWEITGKVAGEEKFMICNGDEGDPGAYMDRSILEGDPHAVLEGMMIGAYAIGANYGWYYIRAEYPLAIERMQKAINHAKRAKLLNKPLWGTDFKFNCEIRLGAGAFVCGEETALIHSIEGKRGTPRPKPPFPAEKGLWGMPSCVNNVETLANVPRILANGASWYAGFGTEKSKGTKVFALTGKIENSGLVEVPMGITMREIVEEIGGGIEAGRALRGVQSGGPSGGLIPAKHLDTPVTYENLQELGSIMGSGGLIVMDDTDSMIDIAKFYLAFTVDESCGKCVPCRIGGKQMLGLLEKISQGKGSKKDIEVIHRISHSMRESSLCALGQTAPNPVLSTMSYFADEYEKAISGSEADSNEPATKS